MNQEEWDIFPVEKKKIKIPIQLEMFEKDSKRRAHVSMGLFYELLCISLFGGYLADQFDIKVKGKEIRIAPDVFVPKEKRMIESKANRTGHQLNLLDGQIDRYKTYQSLYPNHTIYYVIWRHSLRNIRRYHWSIETLFEDLCNKTLCAMILPFSLILKLHENKDFKRYETDKWDHCTRMGSYILNLLFSNPTMFFKTICMNGDRDRFFHSYYMLPEVRINQFRIDPFPIVWVKDLNYREWADKMIDEYIPF
jgi:hypothetical protein